MWQKCLTELFDRSRQPRFSHPSIYVHGEAGCFVTRQNLSFFDVCPALNDKRNIGDTAGVKIDLAFGSLLVGIPAAFKSFPKSLEGAEGTYNKG